MKKSANISLSFDFNCYNATIYYTLKNVQVPPSAPNKNKTNLDENSKFVLFFTRDYFGLIVKLK